MLDSEFGQLPGSPQITRGLPAHKAHADAQNHTSHSLVIQSNLIKSQSSPQAGQQAPPLHQVRKLVPLLLAAQALLHTTKCKR